MSFPSNAVLYLSVNAFSCGDVPAYSERESVMITAQAKVLILERLFIGREGRGFDSDNASTL